MCSAWSRSLSYLLFVTVVTQQCHAGEITYAYVSDTDLIPTKQGELVGDNLGDTHLFGGSIYQIAVGDVTNSRVTVYHQDYFFVEGGSSSTVFSEQAVLVAVEGGVGSPAVTGLGYAIDAYDDILMASAPTGNSNYGGVFVYHDNINDQWTQMQNLQPINFRTLNGNFGYDVALDNNGSLAIIGEPNNDYITTDAGAAYIFGTANGDKKTYWTQLQELYPDNGPANSYFGAQVEMFGKYAAVTSPASCEIYLYEEETPKPKPCPPPSTHSHSHISSLYQKSLHEDTINIASAKPTPRISGDRFLHWSLKQKLHAPDCSTGKDNMEIAFDEGRLVVTDKQFGTNLGKVFIYEIVYRSLASCTASIPRRSLAASDDDHSHACKPPPPSDCTSEEFSLRTSITGTANQYLGSAVDLNGDVLVVSTQNADGSGTVFVYQRIDAVTWNLVQTISNPNSPAVSKFGTYAVGISGNNEIMATSLTGAGATGTANLYTYDLDTTWNCIVISMIDLFGDGWSGARLKVTTSTGITDYFFPRNAFRRDQSENPTYVRYCPDDWDMSNTNTFIDLEIPDALDYPYHWEIRWRVYFENTNQWLIAGDHATKARVQFSRLLQNVELLSVKHPRNFTSKCVDTCETFFSTKAPTKAPTKPSPKKTSPKGKSAYSLKELSTRTSSRLSISEDDELLQREGEEWREIRGEDIFGIGDTVEASEADSQHAIASVAAIPAPAPAPASAERRSLNLRTSAPSISPAPTFLQSTPDYAYPWITLQDPMATTWFQGLDTGTQWFLSTADGKKLLGSGTKCGTDLEIVCKLPLPEGHYPSNEGYVLRVTGDLDSRSSNFKYFFCGKIGGAPSHMDFNIDIYTEFLDGRCTGNNYFTLQNYMSSTLDMDVILKGTLSLGGFAELTLDDLTDTDYNILADMLRNAVRGDANVEVKFHSYYSLRKLAFDMYIPTSVYQLDPRVHGNMNRTFYTAMNYLKASSSRHAMGGELLNLAKSSAQSGLTNSFTSLLSVDVNDITFGSFVSKQHGSVDDWGSDYRSVSGDGSGGGNGGSGSGSGSGSGGGHNSGGSYSSGGSSGGNVEDVTEPVSFVSDGGEESPTLSKTLLTYANVKMGAGVFFALSVMVYVVSRVRAKMSVDDASSLLDVSSTSLLMKKERPNGKRKKSQRNHETDELLGGGMDGSCRSSLDLERGEEHTSHVDEDEEVIVRRQRDDVNINHNSKNKHKNKSNKSKSKGSDRTSERGVKKKQKSSSHKVY